MQVSPERAQKLKIYVVFYYDTQKSEMSEKILVRFYI